VPIGIAALYRLEGQDDVGEMLQVWVTPEYRGKNVAWDLMNAIFKWAGENNFRKIMIRVTDGNARALRFFGKYGFSIVGEALLRDSDGVLLVNEVTHRIITPNQLAPLHQRAPLSEAQVIGGKTCRSSRLFRDLLCRTLIQNGELILHENLQSSLWLLWE
jgi:hypothetical protein